MQQEDSTIIEEMIDKKQEGTWLSLLDASNATGLSPATLRRYIKRRKLRARRLGRSLNAKMEVFVTPDLLADGVENRLSTEGLDEILTADEDLDSDAHEVVVQDDELDYATRETLEWMRARLDEKDAKLEKIVAEKDNQIAVLSNQLQAAAYRNGYLEAQHCNLEEKVKLLVDKEKELLEAIPEEKSGGLRRFMNWFVGGKQI